MRIAVLTVPAFAIAAIAATPAFAQDDAGFTGPRAEIVAGWDHFHDDSNYGASEDGVTYGGVIGYDYQIGHAVIGVEGEASFATTKDEATGVLVTGDSLRVKAGRDLYAGARVGYAVGSHALLYVKGGYTNARVDERYVAPGTPGINISDHDNLDGWRLGAGAEVKVSGPVYLKAEYRYSNYGSSNGLGIDPSRHQVVGGVGVRF